MAFWNDPWDLGWLKLSFLGYILLLEGKVAPKSVSYLV
jgi:hypothetical protein